MQTEPLDFWNYPRWLGDSRDHPGDPRYEPFWVREALGTPKVVVPQPVRQPHAADAETWNRFGEGIFYDTRYGCRVVLKRNGELIVHGPSHIIDHDIEVRYAQQAAMLYSAKVEAMLAEAFGLTG